jgi:hypothetical protein
MIYVGDDGYISDIMHNLQKFIRCLAGVIVESCLQKAGKDTLIPHGLMLIAD